MLFWESAVNGIPGLGQESGDRDGWLARSSWIPAMTDLFRLSLVRLGTWWILRVLQCPLDLFPKVIFKFLMY